MGILNFEIETRHLQKITTTLKRRGLLPVTDEEEWEIHGPHHPELPYQVYVGYAVSRNDPNDCPLVAIYPRAVYEIEERSDWGKALPEKKIPTISSDGGCIPQFPDGSGWNVMDYTYAPYFYEHITPEVVNELVIATAERLYKVVTIRFYDHPHQDTYFVKGSDLTKFLLEPILSYVASLCPTIVVSIEPVESMPLTDEKLTGA